MNHTCYNAQNERLKHEYIKHIQATKGYATKTIDGIVKALNRYEVFTRFLCFTKFNQFEALKFKDYLLSQTNPRTGEPLSLSLVLHIVQPIQEFLRWLCSQKAYRTKINVTDIEYLNLNDKQKAIATAKKERPVPTLEQVKYVIDKMPFETLIERRNRAIILACLILTGCRGSLELAACELCERRH